MSVTLRAGIKEEAINLADRAERLCVCCGQSVQGQFGRTCACASSDASCRARFLGAAGLRSLYKILEIANDFCGSRGSLSVSGSARRGEMEQERRDFEKRFDFEEWWLWWLS